MPADTAPEASSPATTTTTYTRLHISPFDAALTPVVLNNTIRPRARNISYHTLDTFPDKPYGFVELPKEDADKLKKKLNGAVLKGSKVRIEVARPDPQADKDTKDSSKRNKKGTKDNKPHADPDAPPKDRLRKRKREQGVIQGSEIEEPRKIKRGWTTSEAEMIQKKRDRTAREREEKKKDKDGKSSSKKETSSSKDDKKSKKKDLVKKSKYTEEPECLFKTKLPSKSKKEDAPPVVDADKEGDVEDGEKRKKKKRRIETTTTVIHEFEKTQKFPSFLKVSSDKTRAEATTFEEGKGWVDKDGNVVESSKSKRPADAGIVPAQKKDKKKKKKEPTPEPETDSSSDDSSDGKEEAAADTTSDEDDSSDSDSDSSSENEAVEEVTKTPAKLTTTKLEQITQQAATTPTSATRPKSSGSVTSLTIKIPPATPGPAAKVQVHPLEALYKRPAGEIATPAAQGFSFFGGADNDDIEEEDTAMDEPTTQTLQIPMTPFTEQDFEFRTMRSAAPTPDTAHPSRSFAPWSTQDTVDEEDEEEEEDGPESPTKQHVTGDSTMLDADDDAGDVHPSRRAMNGAESAKDAAKKAGPITDFQKHFWENRGDLNRKWRKRRKTAAKEKRYRDNRARADRAI